MKEDELNNLKLNDLPFKSQDKVRYCDTDRQGHVNNANFASFLETGRAELFYDEKKKLFSEDCSFVIANMNVDFIAEIKWPTVVDIGTGIIKMGSSSIHLFQVLYQGNKLVARASTVIVHVNNKTKKSQTLNDECRKALSQYIIE